MLPRLLDTVQALRQVSAACREDQTVDLAVLDFADAFKQLPVHPSEQRFISGRVSIDGVDGWFLVILFGAMAGASALGARRCVLNSCYSITI